MQCSILLPKESAVWYHTVVAGGCVACKSKILLFATHHDHDGGKDDGVSYPSRVWRTVGIANRGCGTRSVAAPPTWHCYMHTHRRTGPLYNMLSLSLSPASHVPHIKQCTRWSTYPSIYHPVKQANTRTHGQGRVALTSTASNKSRQCKQSEQTDISWLDTTSS